MYEAPSAAFACRRCLKTFHQNQSGPAPLRAIKRAIKIRTYLGGSPDLSQPFPKRPKGVSKATYAALRAEALRLQALPLVTWCTVPVQKPSKIRVRKAEG